MAVGITLAPLLALRIAHDYYGNAAVPLALEPTPETAAALRGGCCRLRVSQNGADIYAQVPFGAPPALDPAAPATLTFRMLLRDGEFAIVTAPDWGAEVGHACLSLGPEGVDADGSLAASSGRALPVVGRGGSVMLDAPMSGSQIALHAHGAVPGADPVWTARLPPGPQTRLNLDARGVPEGRYRLTLDGQDLRDLIVSDIPPARLFGLVTVPLDGATPVGPRETPRTLTLRFGTRAPRWRYVFQSFSAARDLSTARVTATPASITFGAPRETTRNGRTVWTCESDMPIPLVLRPKGLPQFFLNLPPEAGAAPPPRLLPYASPAATAFERGAQGLEAWSTLYVTV